MEEVAFEGAREIIRALNGSAWATSGMRGNYMVADYGREDDQSYLVIDGAREYLVDGDLDFCPNGSGVNIVNKTNGAVSYWAYQDHAYEIDAMTARGILPGTPWR